MSSISAVDWKEIMKNKAVREVTLQTLSNTAEKHTVETDEYLLRNFEQRVARLKHLLSLSMAEVNAKR